MAFVLPLLQSLIPPTQFMDLGCDPLEWLIVLFYPDLKEQNAELIQCIQATLTKSILISNEELKFLSSSYYYL